MQILTKLKGQGLADPTTPQPPPVIPTEDDMCNVLHLSWHEIIGKYLTSRTEPELQPKPAAGPGKSVDGYSVMRDTDVIKELKDWDHNIFRKASIATYSQDARLEMIRLLKRIADRLQRGQR